MSQRDAFDRTVTSLHEAALDDSLWPVASRRIDEACGIEGNALVVGQGPEGDVQVSYAGLYLRGERHEEIEREYLAHYHPRDERVASLRRQPDGRVVPIRELYGAEELKTSPTYNEYLPRWKGQNGLNVRLVLSPGAHLTLGLADPDEGDAWGFGQIETIERLLPHIRQFARVRRALAGGRAVGASLSGLLDSTRVGVIHLDRHGRVMAANDRALAVLRREDGLRDREGFLSAWLPADTTAIQRLLRAALPAPGSQSPEGGSMLVRKPSGEPGLLLLVNPVAVSQTALGVPEIAAFALLVDATKWPRVNADRVAATLGLTPAESRVASLLAEGRTLRDIAAATGRQPSTAAHHLKQIHRKLGVSRRADLVRLVLLASAIPETWRRRQVRRTRRAN